MTGAALCMTWPHFFVAGTMLSIDGMDKSQDALARGHQLCTQPSVLAGRPAELLRFCFFDVRKFRQSRRIALFLALSNSNIEEISQSGCVYDAVNCEN